MQIIETIYGKTVNWNPDISRKYQQYRKKVHGVKRILAWGYLIRLNLQYRIFQGAGITGDFYEKKRLNAEMPESRLHILEKPEELAERLAEYDVISFDVFDTLVFRPFSLPSDLFFDLSQHFGYLDLERIRREMEEKARIEKQKKEGSREVTLEEIWDMMEQETGIPKEEGMKAEWECEKKYCFANPYMFEVIRRLKQRGKKLILISDMYLGESYIRELLENCGYDEFDGYFVSCDYRKSKNQGNLYDEVKKQCGGNKRYIHVGDNLLSDQKQAERHGFASVPYRNVNELGNKYRAEDMSVIVGSIYRGIVNARLYNGLCSYTFPYEFGYIYGGLFVLGYCQWIHQWVQERKIDKILFLARDGDILSQAYEKIYPDDNTKREYVYWSRLVAVKLTAKDFKYDYFRRFLYHKTNQGYSIESIFQSMELEDMLENFLQGGKYKKDTCLTDNNAEDVKKYFMGNWNTVLRHYEEQSKWAKKYYQKVLNGCQKAAAVDVGWAGSGAAALDHMVNKVWKLDCEIYGLIAGTNSVYNQEPNGSEAFLFHKKMDSYMFSQSHNRDLWKMHNPGKGHNIIVELLLASDTCSLKSFDEAGPVFCRKREEIDSRQVQTGILDFIDDFLEKIKDIPPISGRDAYAPIAVLLDNEEWVRKVLHTDTFKMNLE